MKVEGLSAEICANGTRIRVTRVAPSKAEGLVDDRTRLTGATGMVRSLRNAGQFAQLDVDWDDQTIRLVLAAEDEVELL
jgi:hypothetical protein